MHLESLWVLFFRGHIDGVIACPGTRIVMRKKSKLTVNIKNQSNKFQVKAIKKDVNKSVFV